VARDAYLTQIERAIEMVSAPGRLIGFNEVAQSSKVYEAKWIAGTYYRTAIYRCG